MASLPFIELLRDHRELRIVRSIRYKSGVLHIGQIQYYQRKARKEYRRNTIASEELPTNSLNQIFFKVNQFLNQKDKTKPIREKTELAYYFIPKTHKV